MGLLEFTSGGRNDPLSKGDEQLSDPNNVKFSPLLKAIGQAGLSLPALIKSPFTENAIQELRSDSVVMMLQFMLLNEKPNLKDKFDGLSIDELRRVFLRVIESVYSLTEKDSFFQEAPEIEILYPELLFGSLRQIELSDMFSLVEVLATTPGSLVTKAAELFNTKTEEYRSSDEYAKTIMIPNPTVSDINELAETNQ